MPRSKSTITYKKKDSIAIVSMNRPEFNNAQNGKMTYDLDKAFKKAIDDDDIKVIILNGNGKHFSAGHDIGTPGRDIDVEYDRKSIWYDHTNKPGGEFLYVREQEVYLNMCRRWRDMPKPTIAMVHGACVAGGCMLAWVCDLIIASDDAFFADPVVRMGIPGVEYFAHPYELNPRIAKEFLFLGERMSASRAYEMGMVNKVVSKEELESTVMDMATKISAMPRLGLTLTKQAINHVEDLQGKRNGMEAAFAWHHFSHAHNDLTTGNVLAGFDAKKMAKSQRTKKKKTVPKKTWLKNPLRRKKVNKKERKINKLTNMLGCEYPIIQTAMGWVAMPELVAASSNAGAFGFLALATAGPKEAIEMMDQTLALTDKPFGINFHMFQPGADEIVQGVIDRKIKAVSYSRSPTPEFIKAFKEAGVICIPTVGALKHALKAEQLGADAVVVQGSEGGGHTGSTPTTLLLSSVLENVKIPVVAAGGFRDGSGLAASLAWGASGIAMGTRFMMTEESPVPHKTKKAYLSADIENIKITKKFDGMSHRLIFNDYIAKIDRSNPFSLFIISITSAWKYKQLTKSSYLDLMKSFFAMLKGDDLTISQSVMSANSPAIIQKAMVEGSPDEGAMPSGQVAGLISNLPTCKDLIDQIMKEFSFAAANFKNIEKGQLMSIETSISEGIAEIIIDCPPVNALTSTEWLDLAINIDYLSHNEDVKVVVLKAKGKGFCAGADIKELQEDPTKIADVNDGCWKTARAIHVCNVPVISACHGFILGGGILLAGASDIVLTTEDSHFGLPEIDRGALGGGAHLSRLFPLQAARKMMFTGKPITAKRAFEYGSIESLHKDVDSVNKAALEIAADIASKSPIAMKLAKKALNEIEHSNVDEHYKSEQNFTLELYKSRDSQEARDAFVEKRDADFKDEN